MKDVQTRSVLAMHRFSALVISLTIGVASSFAGQIQLGGANGLTYNYITTADGGIGSVVSNDVERNYDARLFFGATEDGVSPVPYAGYSQTSASTGTLVDNANGVTFNMINDGCNGISLPVACDGSLSSNNYWAVGLGNTGSASLIIPVGIFDVTRVYTMMDQFFGASGASDTTLIFNFGSSPTIATESMTVDLNNVGGSVGGELRTSVECSSPNPAVGSNPAGSCQSFALGELTPSGNLNGVPMSTNTLFSFAYNNIPGDNRLAGSSGSVYLDDQAFDFGGLHADQWLVSITVAKSGGGGETAISAVTVEAATPEPSTIWLLVAGLSALGLSRLRHRA